MEYVDGINNNQSTVDTLALKRTNVATMVGMHGLQDDGTYAIPDDEQEQQQAQALAQENPMTDAMREEQEQVAQSQTAAIDGELTVEQAGKQLLEAGTYIGGVSVVNVVHDATGGAAGEGEDTVIASLNTTSPDVIVNEEFGLTARQVAAMRKRGIHVPITTSRNGGVRQQWILTPHPQQFTPEEDATILDGLKKFLPLYIIADRVNCSRDFLEKHIKETPELKQVTVNRKESFKDNLEFQALRLINAGNPAMIMFGLEKQCADRGWGQDLNALESTEGDKIVFGKIEDEEVVKAGKKIAATRAAGDVQMQALLAQRAADGEEVDAAGLAQGAMTGAGENGVPREPLAATRAGENQMGGGYFTAEQEEQAEYPMGQAMEGQGAGGVMDTPWDDGSGEDFSFPG